MHKDFLTAVADRRSYYGIGKESVISEDRLKEIIDHAVKYTPTAFNSQSGRVLLLLQKQHNRLWDMTKEALRKVVPADQFANTESKITSFRNGYGTILYFEDYSIIEALQQQYSLYKNNFPIWSQESSGTLQFIIWTALAEEGIGASLQHYNELIEAEVKKEWKVPNQWKLIAQMPFGNPTAQPGEKQFEPIEERVKVYQ